MLGRTDSRLRMLAILVAFAVFAGAAGLRLGYWQVVAADELTSKVIANAQSVEVESTVRADIVDRRGTLLAKTASFDVLEAHPDVIDPDVRETVVKTLEVILDLRPDERTRIMEQLAKGDQGDPYEVLRNRLTLEESKAVAAAIEQRLLPGITLTPRAVRRYPQGGGEIGTTLAANVLGFVRADGRGGDGIERYNEDRLTVVDPGSLELASIDGIPGDLDGLEPGPLQLTLDAKLQKQVEKELYFVLENDEARSVSAIVMDPHTGAILAAATVPSYDAEDYAAIASKDPSRLRNRLFHDQYEPGSVMKIFTAGAALDLGRVTPTTVVRDQAKLDFWQHQVRNADHKSKGALRVKDVIALSRNVATAKIARKLAPQSTQVAARRLFDFWQKVGLVVPTGAEVTAEEDGTWYPPDQEQWAPVDLANRAFGQGVSVTLPQLARGVSTFVNGGYLIQPHLVDRGDAPVQRERVLKAKVARQATDILVHVTGSVPWYAEGSLIPGYLIGGKTGTAQIWDVRKGDWKGRRFNHSFIGFVGSKRPDVVIAVRIEEPKPLSIKQGQIPLRIESYELFQNVARAAIKHLDIPKSKDPNAGRPIIGTAAASALDPQRNRLALQEKRREEQRLSRQERKAAASAELDAAQPGHEGTGMAGRAGARSGSSESAST